MYEKYLLQLEEAGKIRNLKERSINCYKNYVSYFLNYMGKSPEELTCQDVRDFLLAKKDNGLKAATLNLYNSAIRFFTEMYFTFFGRCHGSTHADRAQTPCCTFC